MSLWLRSRFLQLGRRALSSGQAKSGPESCALVFPGQGAQHIGMARDVYQSFKVAQTVIDEADDACGGTLKKIMFEGPQSSLTLTENAQPAILCHSIALVEVIKSEFGIDVAANARFLLGHSLGEYTALVAAGSISLADAVRLVRLRGKAMQKAVELYAKPTSMQAAIIWGDHLTDIERAMPEIKRRAESNGTTVNLANINGKSQVVLSGSLDAVEQASATFQKLNYTGRTVTLPVSAPFHCGLMAPAALEMEEALKSIAISPLREPVKIVSNVTGEPMSRNADAIRSLLIKQMTHTVQWHRCINYCLENNAEHFFVVGPSRALSNLLKKELPASKSVIPIVNTQDLQTKTLQLNLLRAGCVGPTLPFSKKLSGR